ncbi:WD repeat-containing protein 26, partial [Gryllus bimaculatus]
MSTNFRESIEASVQNVQHEDLSASVALKRESEEGGLSPPRRKKLRESNTTMHGIGNGDMQHTDVSEVAEASSGKKIAGDLQEDSSEDTPKVKDKQDQDIIRLIGHYLRAIGLDRSAELLTQESGCSLDHPAALRFCEHIMQGSWGEVDKDLLDIKGLLDGASETWSKVKFMVCEQKFLEFLDDGRVMAAVNVLREELTPLQYNTSRVHTLSTFMICESWELRSRAMWDGKGEKTRAQLIEKVRECLPPTIMLPPGRLLTLLNQAVEHQKSECLFHNTSLDGLNHVSLLVDHRCTAEQLPCETNQLIHDHSDEVWFCKFSPNGLKLATASKDSTVIIWDVHVLTLTCTRSVVLDDHPFGIAYIAWSPDSNSIIACGREGCSEAWIWKLQGEEPTGHVFQAPEDSLTACAWYGNGESFVVGGSRGHCYHCDSEGRVLDSREGVRVTCLWCQKDGTTMLAADTHHRLRSFSFDDTPDNLILTEDYPIMAFTVNSNDRLALLNIANQGINLWDLKDHILIRKFQGALQGLFTINSCFGGVNEDFIASGSEDGRVCIWNIKKEVPLVSLTGHTGTVNCVSWNPVFHQMLASASDDRTVRIWTPACVSSNLSQEPEKNCSSSSVEATESQQLLTHVLGDRTVRVLGSSNMQCIVPQGSETSRNSPPGENSSSLQPMDISVPNLDFVPVMAS